MNHQQKLKKILEQCGVQELTYPLLEEELKCSFCGFKTKNLYAISDQWKDPLAKTQPAFVLFCSGCLVEKYEERLW